MSITDLTAASDAEFHARFDPIEVRADAPESSPVVRAMLALAEEWIGDAEYAPGADPTDVLIAATFRACALDLRRTLRAALDPS